MTGIVLASSGVILFYLASEKVSGSVDKWGIILTMLSSLSYAMSLIVIKRLLNAKITTIDIITYRFSIIGVIGFAEILYYRPQLDFNTILYLIFIGSFGYTGLFYLLLEGIRNISAVIVAIFVACAPLFSTLITWFLIPNTYYSAVQVYSLAIMFFGLLFPILSDFFRSRDRKIL
jgi:drug/metabolite transporter (DMT)-like permease